MNLEATGIEKQEALPKVSNVEMQKRIAVEEALIRKEINNSLLNTEKEPAVPEESEEKKSKSYMSQEKQGSERILVPQLNDKAKSSINATAGEKVAGGATGAIVGGAPMVALAASYSAQAAAGTTTIAGFEFVTAAGAAAATTAAIALYATIPVAVLGAYLGYKYLPKLFRKIKNWWKKDKK